MARSVLGISCFYHDAAAALLIDGELVAAAQEERFSRRKHDASFPHESIRCVLERGRLKLAQVDHVAFYENPYRKLARVLDTYMAWAPRGLRSFQAMLSRWSAREVRLGEVIRERLPGFHGEVCMVPHHHAHAASAFFPSPFAEAVVLTLDGVGEWATSTLGAGRGNRVEVRYEQRFPHSLGLLYSIFTSHLGFRVNSGEGKVMGLAPYGEPRYAELIKARLVTIADSGAIALNASCIDIVGGATHAGERLADIIGVPPRAPESELTRLHADVAASVQAVCEEAMLRAAAWGHAQFGLRHIVLAGGVALNCVANGRLQREGPYRKVWVQPAAGDAGGALGAAYMVWHHRLGSPRAERSQDAQRGSLLGPSFGSPDIRCLLDAFGLSYRVHHSEPALLDEVAEDLERGKVVGWFHGRMEFGPRALGARSIIGDPRVVDMQRIINGKIKRREGFRPFAPCVLADHAHAWFDVPPGYESPYMTGVAMVRDGWRARSTSARADDLDGRLSECRSRIPAVTHVDNSARLQTVDEARHGRFYRLIRRFFERTGCPVLVNTSFNVRGEPLACSPEDALECFITTDLDTLVIEDFVLDKSDQPAGLVRDVVSARGGVRTD